jgi:hypothetical protein
MCNEQEPRPEQRGKYKRRNIAPVGKLMAFQQTIESYAALRLLRKRLGAVRVKGKRCTMSDLIRFAIAWTAGVYDDYKHDTRDTAGPAQEAATGQVAGMGFGLSGQTGAATAPPDGQLGSADT